jgi:hypothetical protein
LTDPIEGEYTCKADYWVNEIHIGFSQGKRTLSYTIPTGETNAEPTWSAQYATFTATLAGTFKGRKVAEFNGDGFIFDDCYYIGSPRDPFISVTGVGNWITVSSANTYADEIGWGTADINWYRSVLGATPCKTTLSQAMKINRPGQEPVTYLTNSIEAHIGMTYIKAKRANRESLIVY